MGKSFMHLTAIIDRHSHYIVVSDTLQVESVVDCVKKLVLNMPP